MMKYKGIDIDVVNIPEQRIIQWKTKFEGKTYGGAVQYLEESQRLSYQEIIIENARKSIDKLIKDDGDDDKQDS